VTAPNQLWVADITYVPIKAGFLYFSIVLDVFSRRIVGWAMATHLKTELVLDDLHMAVTQRRPGRDPSLGSGRSVHHARLRALLCRGGRAARAPAGQWISSALPWIHARR
jgi:transposase InsO family protein